MARVTSLCRGTTVRSSLRVCAAGDGMETFRESHSSGEGQPGQGNMSTFTDISGTVSAVAETSLQMT